MIDFIDMMSNKNQRNVENRLRDALQIDRARVQISKISRFGLLEMSRQRLRPSLEESSQIVCPRCTGHGTIRGIESLALGVLRLIEEEAMKDKTGKVIAKLPVDVTSFLLNEKRSAISEIEDRHLVQLVVIPDPNLETPHFTIERIRDDDKEVSNKSSYELIPQEEASVNLTKPVTTVAEQPAVRSIHTATSPAPHRQKQSATTKPGMLKRFFAWLLGNDIQPKLKETSKPNQQNSRSRNYQGNRNHSNNQRRRGPRRRDNAHGNDRRRADNSRRNANSRNPA